MKNNSFNFNLTRGRRGALCAALLSLAVLSGCGKDDMDALVLSKDTTYTGVSQETTEVERGDISPVFEHIIEIQGYEEITYRVEKDKAEDLDMIYKATLDKVHVSLGDRVSAGDTLISFKSENLDKELKEKSDKKAEAALKKEHLLRMMEIDSSLDYSSDIALLDEEIRLANVQISDIQDTYRSINIIAEKDGVVSYINPSVQDGFMVVASPMITVSEDAGYYLMDLTGDTDTASEGDAKLVSTDVDFHIGDVYDAKTYMGEYQVEVIAKPGTEGPEGSEVVASDTDASQGADGMYDGKVYLKLVGDEKLKEKILILSINLPEKKDALYVDRRAIISSEKGDFVYKQYGDEFIATEIVKGDEVGQYIIVKEGLEEGDVVSLSE